jgi:hypothetical protein
MRTHEDDFLMRHIDLQQSVGNFEPVSHLNYLLVALHQLKRLALDVVLAANDVGKDGRQISAIKLRHGDLDVELAGALVLQLELQIVFL